MRILLFLFIVFLFGCGEVPDADTEKPNGLYSAGDTIEVTTTSEGVSARSISTTTVQEMKIVDEKKDTNIITITPATKTFTYNYADIDTVVKRYKGGVTNPPPVDPPPPTGNLLYSNPYDKASDINANQLGRGSISTFALVGSGSFRTEVRGSDEAISSGYRSEQQYDGSQYMPAEGVYEYDVYYENWKAVSGGGHSVQWHPKSIGGSAVLSLQNYGGKFNVVRSLGGTNSHQSGTLLTTKPNVWYHMRWEIKWSTGNDGYIKLYIDNSLYYSFTGKTSDGGQYLKVGQNRWSMKSGENTVVYYDNLRILKK